MSIDPLKASERLEESPEVHVFSHNSKHFANNRDCYEVGPLPERARRALITWLHNSVVKEMSYVYPQYYVTTYNKRGVTRYDARGGEVVWGILSDGKGNMIGVLVPTDKRIPAWDMPSIGSHRVFVCETSAKKVLSDAIMEDLANARYDERRIESLKATGLDDPSYLVSKPVAQEEQEKDKAEAEGGQKEQDGGDAKKADDVQVSGPSDSAAKPESDTTSEEDEPLSPGGEEETSTDETEDTGDSSGDDSDTGSEESSGDEEGSTGEE